MQTQSKRLALLSWVVCLLGSQGGIAQSVNGGQLGIGQVRDKLPLVEDFIKDFDLGDGHPFENTLHSPAIADLDGDGKKEILLLRGNGFLYGLNANGNELFDPIDLAAITKQGINDTGTGSIPAIANMDGDSDLEIIVPIHINDFGVSFNNETRILVFERDGSQMEGWPSQGARLDIAASHGSLVVSDFDHDGKNEVLILGNRPSPSFGAYSQLALVDDDGEVVREINFGTTVYANPALGDLNQDGYEDVVFVDSEAELHAISGWDADSGDFLTGVEINENFPIDGYSFRTSVAIGDIDANGSLEIVMTEANYDPNRIHVFTSEGKTLEGWPRAIGDGFFTPDDITSAHVLNSPSLANLDKDPDGTLEIVYAARIIDERFPWGVQYFVNSRKADGTLYKPNAFPAVVLNGPLAETNVSIADITGDGIEEVIYLSESPSILYAFDQNGKAVIDQLFLGEGLSYPVSGWSTPVISDLKNDGDVDLVLSLTIGYFGGTMFGRVRSFDIPSKYNGGSWTRFMHNDRHTGNVHH